jgi:hypothetical protein|tara:strand:- start:3101 stop:3484 length:384 start_codon:yes stop_codon:yes gene_type:complete
MNKNYYNGKYNIIKPNMSLVDETFKIRKQELDNDEVFSGNLVLKKNFENLDYDKIFSLPLDDNIIYVNGVNYSHIHTECSIDDSIAYCGSFVLWILGNNHRLPQNLFSDIRSHRIFPKNIWEALDEL